MFVRHHLTLVGALAAVACAPRPLAPPTPVVRGIDTLALRAHTSFLADDLLEGRGTGRRGAELAARYIEAQCRALGLRPVGASYGLDVPMLEAAVRPETTVLRVRRPRDTTAFAAGPDFLVVGGTRSALRGFAGEPVFVGTADAIRQAPDALPPLHGRVALTAGPVQATVAAILAARGAVALVHLLEDERTYRLYAASRDLRLTLLDDPGVPSSFFPALPAVIAAPRVAAALAEALRGGRVTLELRAAFDETRIPARNVACLLSGGDRRLTDTAIALTAHYDHLGISLPDERGDSIYNGFSDNAAGVAMLLAIAQHLTEVPVGLRHSVLFLFFTGEERGLLGSDYFVAHPPLPLERIRAVINLDAGAPPAPPWNWRVAGGSDSPLGALAVDVAAARGWSATVSPATPNSDYFPFARRGVPALFLIPGSAPYQGLTADSSQALRRRWDRYHQPGDEYDDAFPFSGLQRYAEYALALLRALDGR